MEAYNLQTASTYINNVLLARGLLKGGKPIDFAQPENDEGGTSTTMARIINLVNDLVLRRDVCLESPSRVIGSPESNKKCSVKLSTERIWPRRFGRCAEMNHNKHLRLYVDIAFF